MTILFYMQFCSQLSIDGNGSSASHPPTFFSTHFLPSNSYPRVTLKQFPIPRALASQFPMASSLFWQNPS